MNPIISPVSNASCEGISDAALHAQRMESIGALAAGIAHDLNNVLSAVLMSTQMLRGRLLHEDDVALLDVAESGGRRAADLVRQILAFARGHAGAATEVSPLVVVGEIEKMIRATFPRTIDLQVEADDALWSIQGDATRLHQVLLNLCINARDAMPRGGTLSLRASNFEIETDPNTTNGELGAGPYVMLEVSDTGTGIAPEIREKIFEPFFTTKEPGKGTGLGLATVNSIVESHGGRLECESEIGRGTTFRILFPAVPSETLPDEAAELHRGRGELILVVDDEEPLRDVTRMTLEHFGYRVITAEDGAQGLALFAENRKEIAVVVSDHNMPVMDGSAMLRAIHQIAPGMRTVTASGHSLAGNELKIDGGHPHMTIKKPWTAESLIGALSTVLNAS
jgi:nitrogen-specific signal transduction histidine kinase/CheY-like chemotaxis protein